MKKTAMKKSAFCAILFCALSLTAHAKPQEDAASVLSDTVGKKSVRYTCQGGKKVRVVYGFNKQGLPTFAEAKIGGKTRFMPINLAHSDNVGTRFGDENNFSMAGGAVTSQSYRNKDMMITAPDGEIVYQNCNAPKKRYGKR